MSTNSIPPPPPISTFSPFPSQENPKIIGTSWAYTSILGKLGSRRKVEIQQGKDGNIRVELISQSIFDRVLIAIGLPEWITPPKLLNANKEFIKFCQNIFKNASNSENLNRQYSMVLENDLYGVLATPQKDKDNMIQLAKIINDTLINHFTEIANDQLKEQSKEQLKEQSKKQLNERTSKFLSKISLFSDPDKLWQEFPKKIFDSTSDLSALEAEFAANEIQTLKLCREEALQRVDTILNGYLPQDDNENQLLPFNLRFNKFLNSSMKRDANIRELIVKRRETWESYIEKIENASIDELSIIMDSLSEEEVVDDILIETLTKHHSGGLAACIEALEKNVDDQRRLLEISDRDSQNTASGKRQTPASTFRNDDDLNSYIHCLNICLAISKKKKDDPLSEPAIRTVTKPSDETTEEAPSYNLRSFEKRFSEFLEPIAEVDNGIATLVQKRRETWVSIQKAIDKSSPDEHPNFIDTLAEEEFVDDILLETLKENQNKGFDGCLKAVQKKVIKELQKLNPRISDSIDLPGIEEAVWQFEASTSPGYLEDLLSHMHCLNLFQPERLEKYTERLEKSTALKFYQGTPEQIKEEANIILQFIAKYKPERMKFWKDTVSETLKKSFDLVEFRSLQKALLPEFQKAIKDDIVFGDRDRGVLGFKGLLRKISQPSESVKAFIEKRSIYWNKIFEKLANVNNIEDLIAITETIETAREADLLCFEIFYKNQKSTSKQYLESLSTQSASLLKEIDSSWNLTSQEQIVRKISDIEDGVEEIPQKKLEHLQTLLAYKNSIEIFQEVVKQEQINDFFKKSEITPLIHSVNLPITISSEVQKLASAIEMARQEEFLAIMNLAAEARENPLDIFVKSQKKLNEIFLQAFTYDRDFFRGKQPSSILQTGLIAATVRALKVLENLFDRLHLNQGIPELEAEYNDLTYNSQRDYISNKISFNMIKRIINLVDKQKITDKQVQEDLEQFKIYFLILRTLIKSRENQLAEAITTFQEAVNNQISKPNTEVHLLARQFALDPEKNETDFQKANEKDQNNQYALRTMITSIPFPEGDLDQINILKLIQSFEDTMNELQKQEKSFQLKQAEIENDDIATKQHAMNEIDLNSKNLLKRYEINGKKIKSFLDKSKNKKLAKKYESIYNNVLVQLRELEKGLDIIKTFKIEYVPPELIEKLQEKVEHLKSAFTNLEEMTLKLLVSEDQTIPPQEPS